MIYRQTGNPYIPRYIMAFSMIGQFTELNTLIFKGVNCNLTLQNDYL